LDVGDHGQLVFVQIANQPQVAATVLDARRPLGRAGLRYDDSQVSDTVCARLAALAAGQTT
jgi:hypothetical protein